MYKLPQLSGQFCKKNKTKNPSRISEAYLENQVTQNLEIFIIVK